eukprot:7562510-Pyramimonas_sp.AAC.1
MVWSLAAMGYAGNPVGVEALLGRCRGTLAAFDPQNLANLVWGLATLRHQASTSPPRINWKIVSTYEPKIIAAPRGAC